MAIKTKQRMKEFVLNGDQVMVQFSGVPELGNIILTSLGSTAFYKAEN